MHAALARSVQENLRAEDVRAYEVARRVDASVDVTFGGEVDDGVRALFERGEDALAVADVAAHEAVAFAFNALQVVKIPGVGQRVEIDDARVRDFRQHEPHEGRAD